jgi:hypothetical protein
VDIPAHPHTQHTCTIHSIPHARLVTEQWDGKKKIIKTQKTHMGKQEDQNV